MQLGREAFEREGRRDEKRHLEGTNGFDLVVGVVNRTFHDLMTSPWRPRERSG
jgi:hypothetical protein